MDWNTIIQAIVIAGITTAAGGYVNSKIMETRLGDLRDRIVRIEAYLNGLLKEKK